MEVDKNSAVRSDEHSSLLTDISITLQETRTWVADIMDTLGWSKDHLLQKDETLEVCNLDEGHRMPSSALDKHKHYCYQKQRGHSKEEVDSWQSSEFFYDKSSSVVPVHVDRSLQLHILSSAQPDLYIPDSKPESNSSVASNIPARDDDDLAPGERLAIHQYCVAQAKKHGTRTSMSTEELLYLQNRANEDATNKSEKTPLDKLAEERDQKRQRMKYKGTSTSNKSHKQVIGEVIEKQMAVLADIWQEQQKQKEYQQKKQQLDSNDKNTTDNSGTKAKVSTDNENEHSKESLPLQHRSSSKDRDPDRKHKKHKKTKSRRHESSNEDEHSTSRHSRKHKHKKHKHSDKT